MPTKESGILLFIAISLALFLGIFNSLGDFDPETGTIIPRKKVKGRYGLAYYLFGRYIFAFKISLEILHKEGFKRLLSLILEKKSIKDEIDRRNEEAQKMIAEFLISGQLRRRRGADIGIERFLGGFFIILYLFVSVSASSIYGVNDAKMGKKSMIGNWQSEATYIFSEIGNLPLPLEKTKSTSGVYVYGPLIILGVKGNTYYLTDWIQKFPFETKPDVYIVQLNENTNLGMQIIAPTPLSPISFGLFQTPIPNPSSTLTLTPIMPTP